MNIGDLVDDGLDNFGIILNLIRGAEVDIYWVHFPMGDGIDGWYDDCDIRTVTDEKR